MPYDPRTNQVPDADLDTFRAKFSEALTEMALTVVGQHALLQRLIMALLADGHVLLEGVPGLAKTTAVRTLAAVVGLEFRRIQFTPDLLPADIVGTQIYDPTSATFRVKRGPVFASLILADEINRAPAKVQSALLEAMEERQVTIAETTFRLPRPFLVLATQNPIEQEGTYPLPEAQTDRFMFKVRVTYPSPDEEFEILNRAGRSEKPQLKAILTEHDIVSGQALTARVYVADPVRRYMVRLVTATRHCAAQGLPELAAFIAYGASPRAALSLDRAARVNALLEGRGFVTPQDVKDVALDVMRHRLVLTYEAEAAGRSADSLVQAILDRTDVP